MEKNKIRKDKMTCYNLDAREFIRTVFVQELKRLTEEMKEGGQEVDVHITMNLPALAITFLDVFQGLLNDWPDLNVPALPRPTVHVYTFSKAEDSVADVRE